MDNGLIGLIGLSRKAGKLELGEEPVTVAANGHKARLILLAADAAENTVRRARNLGERGNCPVLVTGLTKTQLGGAAGRSACALLAFTDVGLAAAAATRLSPGTPEYAEVAERLSHKAAKTDRRRKAQREKEKARQAGARKPWAPPPPGGTGDRRP